MKQHDKPDKKPRLQHADLAESNLTAEEKQRERQRRWLANEKRDPARRTTDLFEALHHHVVLLLARLYNIAMDAFKTSLHKVSVSTQSLG
jgi:hypothetical protein